MVLITSIKKESIKALYITAFYAKVSVYSLDLNYAQPSTTSRI